MTTNDKPDEAPDRTLSAAVTGVAATAVVLTIGAALSFGLRAALGVGIGGAVATVNLVVLARIVRAFLGNKGNTAPWAIIAVIKLGGLIACVWLVMRTGVVSGLSLAIGYGSLPIGVTLGTLFGPKPPETPEPDQDRKN